MPAASSASAQSANPRTCAIRPSLSRIRFRVLDGDVNTASPPFAHEREQDENLVAEILDAIDYTIDPLPRSSEGGGGGAGLLFSESDSFERLRAVLEGF
jgi:hypothetical protein